MKELTFKLGETNYRVVISIKKGTEMDPTYRGIILDIDDGDKSVVRYIRYTDGSCSVSLLGKHFYRNINSWKEAKGIILNYILNG